MAAQAPADMPTEVSALQKMLWFGVLQLAGIVAGWVVGFYVISTAFSGSTMFSLGQNATSAQTSAALGPVFRSVSMIFPIVSAVQIAALLMLTMSFWELKKVDGRFSLPSVLMLALIVGGVLAVAGFEPFFGSLTNILAQAPTPSAPNPSAELTPAIASLLFSLVLLGVGGLLALIGFFGGQMLGLWRAGSRYNETLLKLGAIFAVIPFLNLVAPVLVIVGANQVRNRLRAGHG